MLKEVKDLVEKLFIENRGLSPRTNHSSIIGQSLVMNSVITVGHEVTCNKAEGKNKFYDSDLLGSSHDEN